MRLMIEGNASYLARVLAALAAAGLSDGPNESTTGTTPSPQAAASPTPTAPIPPASFPMPSISTDDDDDDAPAAYEPIAGAPAETDATGLPWDERIHAKSRAKNADGSWRKRKVVDDATVAAVIAQLRASQPPAAAPVMMPPIPLTAVAAPPPSPMVSPPVAGIPPMAPPAPAAIAALPPLSAVTTVDPTPPPPVVAGPLDFPTFFMQLQQQLKRFDASGKPYIDSRYLADVTAKISAAWQIPLVAITDLAADPNAGPILDWAVATMRAEGRWS